MQVRRQHPRSLPDTDFKVVTSTKCTTSYNCIMFNLADGFVLELYLLFFINRVVGG